MNYNYNTSFVLPNGYDIGGVTSWSVDLANRLGQFGLRTTLVEHVERKDHKQNQVPLYADQVECAHDIHPNYRCLFRKDINAYTKCYARLLPSVLIPNYSFGSYAACAQLVRKYPEKIRVIGMAHTDNDQYYEWLVRFSPIINTFIVVSSEIAKKLSILLPDRKNDIVQRACGVAVDDKLHREYTPSSQPLKLIFAGRLTERQKRVSDLVRLAVALEDKEVNFELHIYGDGRDRSYLKSLIDNLTQKVSRRINLHGKMQPSEMVKLYRCADILVLVSDYEGTSLSMLESMAQGCVPVTSMVSGARETVEKTRSGFVVPVGAISEMVEKIAWLDCNRNLLTEYGNRAHIAIKKQYSYDKYVPWFVEILNDVWQKEPMPGLTEYNDFCYIPVKDVFKEVCYTIASKRGFQWLYRFKDPMRRYLQ